MNIDKITQAINEDAGFEIEGLREGLSEMEEGKAARIHSPEQILVRSVRKKAGLSQQEFADLIKTPVATLRDWEQGRFTPPGGVICLLKITIKHPELLQELAA